MLLRYRAAATGLALSLCGCPGGLSASELIAFENGARADAMDAGDDDAGDDDGASPACSAIPTLLKTSCGQAGCHGMTAPAGGLDLVSSGLAARLNGKVSNASCSGGKLIDVAAPERSLIYTQLAPAPNCGLAMPLGQPALSDEQKACVLAWIELGAPGEGTGDGEADAGSDGKDAGPIAMPGDDAGPGTPAPDLPVGTELNRTGWLASASRTGTQANVGSAQAALDGDLSTRWGTGVPQDGTSDWFQVDMTATQKLSTIELRMGMYDQDHPRKYQVYASNDPASWGTAVATGTTPDQKQQIVSITFPVQTARYIRIENTGVDADNWWSIYELVVKR